MPVSRRRKDKAQGRRRHADRKPTGDAKTQIAPGLWADPASQTMHVDAPVFLIAHGFEPTAANQDALEKALRRHLAVKTGAMEVVTTQDPEVEQAVRSIAEILNHVETPAPLGDTVPTLDALDRRRI